VTEADLVQEARVPAVGFDWARFEGYGDNGAVMFCATQGDAADGDRAPRLRAEAPVAGDRAWLRLNHPFVFDSISPFWCLYQPPTMQWHGPISDELCRLTLVRCRLARAPSRDGDDGAAARVAVLEALSLCDLARGPVSGTAEPAFIDRLTRGPGAQMPVTTGGYTVLTRDIDDESGEWAILRHDTGITDLLIYGVWDVDRDRMWAGRARLPEGAYPNFS
jgi:hypothetical protein